MTAKDWTKELQTAFDRTKDVLCRATMLTHPDPSASWSITVDASDLAIGGVLEQTKNGVKCPLGFFSRKLRGPELRYSAFDRELLSIYHAVCHYRAFLEGRRFTVWTDHRPIMHAITKKTEPWSNRQARQLSYISEFNCDIQHVSGVENVVADCLSRPPETSNELASVSPVFSLPSLIDASVWRPKQEESEDFCRLRGMPDLKFELWDVDGGKIWVDTFTDKARPFVPEDCRKQVFDQLHELSHPGVQGSRRLVTERFLWLNMQKDIRKWADSACSARSRRFSDTSTSRPGTFRLHPRGFSTSIAIWLVPFLRLAVWFFS